jgi:hypothetical protein
MKLLILSILSLNLHSATAFNPEGLNCHVRPNKDYSMAFEVKNCEGRVCRGTVEYDNINECKMDENGYWICTEVQAPVYLVDFFITRRGNLLIKNIIEDIYSSHVYTRWEKLKILADIHSIFIINEDQVQLKRGFETYKMSCY